MNEKSNFAHTAHHARRIKLARRLVCALFIYVYVSINLHNYILFAVHLYVLAYKCKNDESSFGDMSEVDTRYW